MIGRLLALLLAIVVAIVGPAVCSTALADPALTTATIHVYDATTHRSLPAGERDAASVALPSSVSCVQRPDDATAALWRPSAVSVAAEDGITYGAHDVGPLPESVANTFRGGSYTERTLQSETTLYRVYGGEAGPVGSYWSTTAPSGALQAQLDGAINPAWGNTIERVATARVPAGTTIYEGAAGEQGLAGGGSLLGGGNQVYIPNVDPSWVTP